MAQEKEMSFLDHLEELRWHIIRCTIAIIAAATFAFLGKSFLFDKLIFGPTKTDFFTYDLLCKASIFFMGVLGINSSTSIKL